MFLIVFGMFYFKIGKQMGRTVRLFYALKFDSNLFFHSLPQVPYT